MTGEGAIGPKTREEYIREVFGPNECNVCDWVEQPDQPPRRIGIAAVPGVPMSLAFCEVCLARGASVPLWVGQFQVDLNGSLDAIDPGYLELVTFAHGAYVPLREALADYTPQDTAAPRQEKKTEGDDR